MPSSARMSTLSTWSKSVWADCQPYVGPVPGTRRWQRMVLAAENQAVIGIAIRGTSAPKIRNGARRQTKMTSQGVCDGGRNRKLLHLHQPADGFRVFSDTPSSPCLLIQSSVLASGIFVAFKSLCLSLVPVLISSHEPDSKRSGVCSDDVLQSSPFTALPLTTFCDSPTPPQDSSRCSSDLPKT